MIENAVVSANPQFPLDELRNQEPYHMPDSRGAQFLRMSIIPSEVKIKYKGLGRGRDASAKKNQIPHLFGKFTADKQVISQFKF